MTFCSLAAETCWERWHRNCKKRCKPVYTARHVLPRSNKMRPAKPLATCTVLLFCVPWGRIRFPNQSPLISLIEADAQTTEKYYEEKVPQVILGLCGSTVPSITSYHYTQPVEKTPWNEHGFIEERASGGALSTRCLFKKKEKKTSEKVLWNWWNNLLNKPPVGNTHSHWGQHAVQRINKNTFDLRQCWGQTYPRWTREAQIPSEMKI